MPFFSKFFGTSAKEQTRNAHQDKWVKEPEEADLLEKQLNDTRCRKVKIKRTITTSNGRRYDKTRDTTEHELIGYVLGTVKNHPEFLPIYEEKEEKVKVLRKNEITEIEKIDTLHEIPKDLLLQEIKEWNDPGTHNLQIEAADNIKKPNVAEDNNKLLERLGIKNPYGFDYNSANQHDEHTEQNQIKDPPENLASKLPQDATESNIKEKHRAKKKINMEQRGIPVTEAALERQNPSRKFVNYHGKGKIYEIVTDENGKISRKKHAINKKQLDEIINKKILTHEEYRTLQRELGENESKSGGSSNKTRKQSSEINNNRKTMKSTKKQTKKSKSYKRRTIKKH